MTRAVVFGTVYNPFILRYWLENFKIWQHKVDKVYLCHDRIHQPEIRAYLDAEVAKFPKIEIIEDCGGWPWNMEETIKHKAKEDLILVIHDDTYIYNPDILDKYFELTGDGKVITPLFVHYSPGGEVEAAVKAKYPQMPWSVDGYVSSSFLLYFLFCSRENYLKTDVDFANNLWTEKDYIKELDYTPKGRFGGDTGLKFGFQLLANGVEVLPIKDNNLVNIPHKPDPIGEFNKMVDEGLDWLHLQNISNTIPLWFYSEGDWFAGIKTEGHKIHEQAEYRDNPAVKEGNTMRLAWLEEFMAVDDFSKIKGFYDYIAKEKEYIIDYFKIDRERIDKYKSIIRRLT